MVRIPKVKEHQLWFRVKYHLGRKGPPRHGSPSLHFFCLSFRPNRPNAHSHIALLWRVIIMEREGEREREREREREGRRGKFRSNFGPVDAVSNLQLPGVP